VGTRWLRGLLLALCAFAAYLLFWPVSLNPEAWSPPPAPGLSGAYQTNAYLAQTVWLAKGIALGPEATAVDADGTIYTGLRDGRILRLSPDGQQAETLVNTGGRPLGIAIDAKGNVVTADAFRGLLSISPQRKIDVLAREQGGVPFGLADDVDIAADGKIYFTDVSWRYGLHQLREDILEHRPNGRLLEYDPVTKRVSLALGGLYFANGVAVSADQSFVLVCETASYRVRRYWRSGPKKGLTDIFIGNLPGFPDNITLSRERGIYWLALFAPRIQVVDAIMPHPWLRKIVDRLPTLLQPAPVRRAFALGLNSQGEVVYNLQDPSPQSFAPITSVREHRGMLYLGSLERDAVGRVAAPP
jgi:sugar lactone lactonase YvrE